MTNASNNGHYSRKQHNTERVLELREKLSRGGGEDKIEKQHKKGKLTARERIELLVDEGSFVEIDAFRTNQHHDLPIHVSPGDGVIVGYGLVDGKKIFLYSQDFTVHGGSLGKTHADKICKVMDLAMKTGAPVIGLLDSGGARIQEGIDSLAGYGEIFYRNVQASGVIPQISIILGPCAGGAVYSPALTDFIIINQTNAFMFVTGPEVVKAVTGEEVDYYDLGGSNVHSSKSGVSHLVGEDEEQTIKLAKKLLSYLPSNNLDEPITLMDYREKDQSALANIVPPMENEPYDMLKVIQTVLDEDSFFELQSEWAKNIIIGFGRIAGYTIGVIGNQPLFLGGAIEYNAADKAARFIRFCDSFNIPILTFVDVPGFMPGSKQEHEGIIRHGAKLLFAYSEATVPKIAVITRKAYGGAYIVMSSKHLGADINFAWPTAEIAVMGAEGACKIIYRKEIKEAADPEIKLKELVEQYKDKFSNPFKAAEKGYVDKIILPEETRREIIIALMFLQDKRNNTPKRKHGNIPM